MSLIIPPRPGWTIHTSNPTSTLHPYQVDPADITLSCYDTVAEHPIISIELHASPQSIALGTNLTRDDCLLLLSTLENLIHRHTP